MIFITGGARSGKSRFAEKLAKQHIDVTYIATAEITDHEMADRVKRHQQSRPKEWKTIEAPYQLDHAIETASQTEAILIDCIAVWLSNLLLSFWSDKQGLTVSFEQLENEILQQVDQLISAQARYQGTLIVVSNEVGSGIVPAYPLGRYYRDLLGLCNQKLAMNASTVYWCVSGIPVQIKGRISKG